MTSSSWQKLEIECAAQVSETIAAYFTDITGNAVEIRDNEDNGSDSTTVIAYIADNDPALGDILASARNYLHEIKTLFPEYPPPSLCQNPIANEDWNRKWKERFKPFNLTERLVIKPSWENYSPAGDENVIEIDPGMAFGTGLHASTQLAALFIEEHFEQHPNTDATILDIGTGTGILAMCCASLGYKNIVAIDNDPEAVTAAIANISNNNLAECIYTAITPLESLQKPFDIVIANIIHNTLVEMAPSINNVLIEKGALIMAGILAGKQSENISNIYGSLGIRTVSEKISGEWSALLLEKTL